MNEKEYLDTIKRDPSLAEYLDYVSSSRRNRGYWRARRRDLTNPSYAPVKARLVFALSSYNSFGRKGLVPGRLVLWICSRTRR